MAAIITEKFSLHNAEQFFESFSEAAPHVYYMLFGKTTPYTAATTGGTDLIPPGRQMMFLMSIISGTKLLLVKRLQLLMLLMRLFVIIGKIILFMTNTKIMLDPII